MSTEHPIVYLARHGDTAWTISGQHTGRVDLPLVPQGEQEALCLGERLRGMQFTKVFCSPLKRVIRSCELAGFGSVAEIDPDLMEWDYGNYESLRLEEIWKVRPGWEIFRDGCPGGETAAQVGERADRVITRVRPIGGSVLLFSSGHFLRVLAARWLGLEATAGRYFVLSTASLSTLGYEHNLSQPVIRLWNDNHHVAPIIGEAKQVRNSARQAAGAGQ
jgi:probable phosphoglycerate mutase